MLCKPRYSGRANPLTQELWLALSEGETVILFGNIAFSFRLCAGAHLGGEEDTSPALKMKSVFEQAICPENAL